MQHNYTITLKISNFQNIRTFQTFMQSIGVKLYTQDDINKTFEALCVMHMIESIRRHALVKSAE